MKQILSFSLACLLSGVVFSQNGTKSEHTLLWKISGKGLGQPSYLFGTMHVLCSTDARLSDSLRAAIGRCDEVYFEIDLSDLSGMINSIQYMRMKDDRKLSDLLNGNDYAKVKNYFEKHGSSLLPFGMLERFKPLLISSVIEEDELGCQTTDGMEMIIMKEAKKDNKKINGLETAEFQAGLFDSIPYEKQARDLVNYIDSMDYYKKMMTDLAEVYRRQDLEKIDELTRSSDAGSNEYLDLLLYGRNRKWANILDTVLPRQSLLIAVGAGHLPGEEGLIHLLRKKGYILTPVKNEWEPSDGQVADTSKHTRF